MEVGVLGATGPAGGGLAVRLAGAGHDVLAGSRDPDRARAAAAGHARRWGGRLRGALRGVANEEACRPEVVVLGVNAEAAVGTAAAHSAALDGRVVVSMANSLARGGRQLVPALPPEGSVAEAVAAAVPGGRVAAAWHHIPASELGDLEHGLRGDVLVCADDDTARSTVIEITRSMAALRAFDAGSLANAVGLETFAAALLTVNIRQKVKAGLGLLGVP